MAFKWNRDLIENLIVCVEENTCIYNVKSIEYLDRTKKAQAFHSIFEELNKMEDGITVEDIKRKWRNLRTQYMQKIRAMNQSKRSGSGKDDVYVPKLWCFHQLDFLKVHSEMRQSRNNTQDEENTACNKEQPLAQSKEPSKQRQTDDDNSQIINSQDNTEDGENYAWNTEPSVRKSEVPPKRRLKTLAAISGFRKDLGNVQTMLQQRKTEKPFAWLGTLVAKQMERIRPEDQDDAIWQVQCFMRKLTSESRTRTLSKSTSTSTDILSLSMEGVFDDDDLNVQF